MLAALFSLALFGLLVFGPAGRLGWLAGWAYMALVIASFIANFVYLRRVNPELIEHRMHMGPNTKGWDKVWLAVFTPLFCAVYLVAGLDAGRFGWSGAPAAP